MKRVILLFGFILIASPLIAKSLDVSQKVERNLIHEYQFNESVALNDSVILKLVTCRLREKFNKKKNKEAINYLQQISDNSIKSGEIYKNLSRLISRYENYYNEIIEILREAQNDFYRENPYQSENYIEKYRTKLLESEYYKDLYNESWNIPYMNNLIDEAISILERYEIDRNKYANISDVEYADFSELIEGSKLTLPDKGIIYVNITLKTDPKSDIYVDNKYKGKGEWNGKLSNTVHLVEVKKNLHKNVKKILNISDENEFENIIIESPEPINGILNIKSVPDGATIFIDDIYYGVTPKIIPNIIIGEHVLRLEKENYTSSPKKITINENNKLSLEEKLTQIRSNQAKFGWFIRLGGNFLTGIWPKNKNEHIEKLKTKFGYNLSVGFMSPIKNKKAHWGADIGLNSELKIESFNYEGNFKYDNSIKPALELSQFIGWKLGKEKVKIDPHLGLFLGYGFNSGFDTGCNLGIGVWLGNFNIDINYHQSFVSHYYKYYYNHSFEENNVLYKNISYLPYSIQIRLGFTLGKNR